MLLLQVVQASLFMATLVFINLESFLCKRLVMVNIKEEGFFIPEFHPHRLIFNPKTPGHRCR